jgi:uncharacterized coiled-coil DUF342 family protein
LICGPQLATMPYTATRITMMADVDLASLRDLLVQVLKEQRELHQEVRFMRGEMAEFRTEMAEMLREIRDFRREQSDVPRLPTRH